MCEPLVGLPAVVKPTGSVVALSPVNAVPSIVTALVVAMSLKMKDEPVRLIAFTLSAVKAATVDFWFAAVAKLPALAFRFIVSKPFAVRRVVTLVAADVDAMGYPNVMDNTSEVPAEAASAIEYCPEAAIVTLPACVAFMLLSVPAPCITTAWIPDTRDAS
jgi:hypothetical protein